MNGPGGGGLTGILPPIYPHEKLCKPKLTQLKGREKIQREKNENECTGEVEIRTKKKFLAQREACATIFGSTPGFKGRTSVNYGFSTERTLISASAVPAVGEVGRTSLNRNYNKNQKLYVYVCIGFPEKKHTQPRARTHTQRGRERDRQTEIERQTETDRERQTETETETDRQIDRQTETQREIETERQRQRQREDKRKEDKRREEKRR